MNTLTVLKVALRCLRRTLVRSALTALGIIVGVGAVIAMVSIGNGARAEVESVFAHLDTNRVGFSASMPRTSWRNGVAPKLPARDGLSVADYDVIRTEIGAIESGTVFATESAASDARANGRRSAVTLIGISTDGLEMAQARLVHGTGFGSSDVLRASAICVVPEFLARSLFGNVSALGRRVQLRDTPFTVVGVFADRFRGDPAQIAQGDTTVFVPYTSLLRRVDPRAVISFAFRAKNPRNLALIQQQVSDLLERRRGTRKAEFIGGSVAQLAQAYRDGSQTMTNLLGAIAAISLVVGGIGVMNIMLVNVTERTREIGIRLSLGTRARDIRRQFLLEATLLSFTGGLAGTFVGIATAKSITYLNDWPTSVTPGSIAMALFISVGVGISFGYYPAKQASRLDPVEALRCD